MTTTERTARPEIGGQEVDFQPSEMMTAGAVVETVMNHLEEVVDMIGVNNRAIQLKEGKPKILCRVIRGG